MHSNRYTLIFTSVLTIILASLLSVAAGSLNQIQKLNVEIDSTDQEIKKQTLIRPNVKKWIDQKTIRKIIIVKGKIINIVV